MNKLVISVVLSVLSFSLKAQEGTSISIYFQSDSYQASNAELVRLNTFLNDRDCESCSVSIKGHTDADASDEYNETLSERRVLSLKKKIQSEFSCFNITKTSFHGENEPITDNSTDEGKAKNRRVEVVMNCVVAKKEEKEEEKKEVLQSIWNELYAGKLPPRIVDCGTKEIVSFTNYGGVKVLIDSNTFGDQSESLKLRFYTCTNKQEAFNHGFTTETESDLLESKGMFKLEAIDQYGRLKEPVKKDGIHVFIPIQGNLDSSYGRFASVSKDGYILWTPITSDDEHIYSPKKAIMDMWEEGGERTYKCKLFWCKIKTFFLSFKREKKAKGAAESISGNKDVVKMYDLFEDKMEGNFASKTDFIDFLANNSRERVLEVMNEVVPGFDDISYYILDLPDSKWVNCDRFTSYPNRMDIALSEDYNIRTDTRLFFDKMFSIMRASSNRQGKSTFIGVPVGQAVTLIIVKKINDVIYLSKEKFTTGSTPIINFRKVNADDLKTAFEQEN